MATYLGRIQLLAKPGADWAANDAVLLNGEIGAADVGSSVPILKIGDGVRPWSLLPNLMAPVDAANDYVAGPTTTLPPGSAATVTIDNITDPPTISFGIPSGNTGPPNTLTIGTVTTGAPGTPAAATITGVAPNQVLSLTIPEGEPSIVPGPIGPLGPTGPANVLTIGTVTTGAPGSAAAATITGVSPAQVLSLTIPQGAVGPPGPQGDPGVGAPAASTATIGLVRINGVATTFMRSDEAPPLSQAIVPTWTGAHIFTATTTFAADSGPLLIRSALPALLFDESDEASGSRRWAMYVAGSTLRIAAMSDASSAGTDRITITRAGVVDLSGGDLRLTAHAALTDVGDGFLRLNNSSHYANGVYTPGPLRADIALRSPVLSDTGATKSLIWNTGAFSFGSAYISGAVGSYVGLVLSDSGVNPTFMSNGTSAGIHMSAESKWLIVRSSSFVAVCNYQLEANAFNVASARKLKRETGTPAHAAEILSRLRPILYRLRADKNAAREQLGLIAEEVHAVCPYLSDGKTVSYDRLALLLLADWQAARGLA